ncbi:hypothetical protein LTS16_012366 [Friedmanniomyces endolithicus]|nr:hypothetical protein LTR94_009749 [Friedmanniomyces endolithicus]KAK0796304.1 hypothetical protein LTR38_008595 [Friedmanniomyces endolithicus]KAK0805624.1 hypothetical protein LTR75_007296 [Friedmanniomyces endolithicus]KAK0811412.1 hypothetical protein LTR59_001865 [Friedmanniomyces endolithicus]KAK1038065.1 hypothetical protein LTS16_012366 [Friedmanniomyces endolithicus]
MSLKYGLTVKGSKAPPAPSRPTLDEEDDDDEEPVAPISHGPPKKAPPGSKPPTRPRETDAAAAPETDLSSTSASKARLKTAQEVDPSIFDYDSFHAAKSTVTSAKKAAARQEALDRKPKYINNLLEAAARRKQDQLVAKEKLLQKEREAEGDEFAGKEKFVTGAYKEQQVEARRLEEEEKRRGEEEERRKRVGGGGMQGFYRGMIDEQERVHREAVEAAEKVGREIGEGGVQHEMSGKTDADKAAELKAKGVHLNEDGQIIDKRELLSAGLNVGSAGGRRGAEHLKASNRPAQSSVLPKYGNQQASRERQTRMMEEQLAERTKRAREEEDAEREKLEQAAKTQKTDTDKLDAKARYLARKAAKERGEA